jgi:signal transduction histidine kinase
MDRESSILLGLGEWLLRRRWWWTSLASLSVFVFEFIEYQPFQQGVKNSFFFELAYYGVALPVSTGLALSWLARRRAELAWSIYYQNLIPNLALQLHDTHTYEELAEVFLQFVRVVIPVIGVRIYKYEQNGRNHKTVLNWPLENELPLHGSDFACQADMCPIISVNGLKVDTRIPQLCRDPHVTAASRKARLFCLPFVFSNSLIAGARLYFPRDTQQPSPEQVRLLKEVAPTVASTFQRIQLELLMEQQGDQISAEQQRIARDVHDTLGHSLAYLRLRLDQMSMEFNQVEVNTLHKEVETLRDIAKEAYDQMRGVLVALSPNGNANLGDTLVNYADKVSQRANFKFEVHHHGKPQALPPVVQRNIFYIFQEILTNVEKHASARLVKLDLHWEETRLVMQVQDDGLGFDTAAPIPNGHFGLKNIRERALESGAQFSVSSEAGRGACLELRVPYEAEV